MQAFSSHVSNRKIPEINLEAVDDSNEVKFNRSNANSIRLENETSPIHVDKDDVVYSKGKDDIAPEQLPEIKQKEFTLSQKTKNKLLKCSGIILMLGTFALIINSMRKAELNRIDEKNGASVTFYM